MCFVVVYYCYFKCIDERLNFLNNKYFKEKYNSKKGERDLLW